MWLGRAAFALALEPDRAGYWIQHGHMCKEQGRLAEAEASYRSGAALGAEAAEVIEHLRFVMARQDVSETRFPIRLGRPGDAADRPPTVAAVRLLARLLWRAHAPGADDVLALLRAHATCDEVFAAMVADPRFERANIGWLAMADAADFGG